MRFSKKLTLLPPALLCIVMLLVSACGGGGTTPGGGTSGTPQPASADKQVFRYPIGPDDFTSIDPSNVQYTTDAYADQTIFTGLVQLNDKGEVVDQMAASHQISSDGLTYTFTLKPGLKFSNGDPLTSQDVVYSINRLIDPATKSQVSYYVSLIKGFDDFSNGKLSTLIGSSLIASDPQTVKIVISKPAAYFLAALTYPATYPVNKKLIDKYGGTKWIDHMEEGAGDGPFMVQSYSHTIGMTLVPNPNYYGPKPRLQKLQFLISGDPNTTYKAYLSGQFDLAAVPATNLAQAKTRPDFHQHGVLVIWYIAMNYLYKPFDNVKIRQAFDLAINKDLLVSSVLRGAHKPTNHIVPEGMPGYNPNLKGPDGTTKTSGDTAMAQQLFAAGLKEEGYASAAALPPITFLNRTNSPRLANIMTTLIQMWKTALGVTLKTQLYDNAKFNDQLTATRGHDGPAELWIAGWQADYPDPQDWLTTFFAKGADYNQFNYGQNNSSDAATQQGVQDKLLAADVNSDANARLAAYNDAEQQIVNDVGWLSLYQAQGQSLLNPKIAGYTFNNLNITAPDDWGSIYVTQ